MTNPSTTGGASGMSGRSVGGIAPATSVGSDAAVGTTTGSPGGAAGSTGAADASATENVESPSPATKAQLERLAREPVTVTQSNSYAKQLERERIAREHAERDRIRAERRAQAERAESAGSAESATPASRKTR